MASRDPQHGGSAKRVVSVDKCAFCEVAEIVQPCKLCNALLYCSKECAKNDTKRHKKLCPRLASALQNPICPSRQLDAADEMLTLLAKHTHCFISKNAGREQRTVDGASSPRVVNAAVVAAKKQQQEEQQHQQRKDQHVQRQQVQKLIREQAEMVRLEVVEAALKNLGAICQEEYGDPVLRRKRSELNGETCESYADYLSAALRQAFPPDVREEKILVVGCGNSPFSETMCRYGFRDVLSTDISESVIAKMSERSPRFHDPGITCRYEVMDPSCLSLDTETFGGVVDKGTIDSELSGPEEGLKRVRRICDEAMRVLKPGGKLLVLTKSSEVVNCLLDMCGQGSACDATLAVDRNGGIHGARAYAHIIRKASSSNGKLATKQSSRRALEPEKDVEGLDSAKRDIGDGRAVIAKGAAGRATKRDFETGSSADVEATEDSAKTATCRGEVGNHLPPSNGNLKSGALELHPAVATTVGEVEQVASKGPVIEGVNRQPVKDDGNPLQDTFKNRDTGNGFEREELPVGDPASASLKASPFDQGGSRDTLCSLKSSGQVREMKAGMEVVAASLPWGVRDDFSEDKLNAYYELTATSRLAASELSVEFSPTRLKVSHSSPGPDSRKSTWVDRELRGAIVTAESTWCIEDGSVVSITLSKRTVGKWNAPFKPVASRPYPVECTKTNDQDVVYDGAAASKLQQKQQQEEEEVSRPFPGDVWSPSPPPEQEMHDGFLEKMLFDESNEFEAPTRFLVEDQVGIKMLQVHLSKPLGYKIVLSLQVSRVGPEECEIKALCHDGSGRGRPNKFLLQRANLGRADFDEHRASLEDGGGPEGGVFVVRVPYGSCNFGESNGVLREGLQDIDEGGNEKPDDEDVSTIGRLRCRFCNHCFTVDGRGMEVRAMPSGRWDVCIEDLICFDGPSAVAMLARDVNFANEGRCLMGKAEVLIHWRDVLPGALAFGDGGASLDGIEIQREQKQGCDGELQGEGQTLVCSRCELHVGRPSMLTVEHGEGKGDLGVVLLKHTILGDDLTEQNGMDRNNANDSVKIPKGKNLRGGHQHVGVRSEEEASSRAMVFEGRTAVKWLMGEMENANDAYGYARFVVVARGHHRATPAGCLSLLLVATHNLVSVSGEQKPHRAHRVGFREESGEEAAMALDEEGCGGHDSPHGDFGKDSPEVSIKRAAGVRARVLYVSYDEYRALRRQLTEAEWASEWTVNVPLATLDRRGYRFSYLF